MYAKWKWDFFCEVLGADCECKNGKKNIKFLLLCCCKDEEEKCKVGEDVIKFMGIMMMGCDV